MKKPLIKICGMTRAQDALLATELGANALGFIFYEKSPRFVLPQKAQGILTEVLNQYSSARLMKVGVFVNPSLDEIGQVLGLVSLSHVQLHGNETPEFCVEVKKLFPFVKLIKALRLGSPEADLSYPVEFELLDHQTKDAWGGTGQTISWADASKRREAQVPSRPPLFLAGGLTAENISRAILEVDPEGLDISSGIEDAPGIKSETKLRALFLALTSNLKKETST